VVGEVIAIFGGDALLQGFDLFVMELNDAASIYIDHVIVVITARYFKDRMATIKIMTNYQTRTFKLSQHPIHRCQTHIIALLHQRLVNIFRTHVMLFRGLQHLQNFHTRQRYFKSRLTQFLVFISHYFPQSLLSVPVVRVLSAFIFASGSPRMKLASRSLLALILTVSLAGCSNFRFPWVHKINVQQGHIVTQDMVSQLKIGMTKRQVRFVLGNSLLPDTFNDDRWDYPYSIRKGSDGDITSYLFTVYFENDKLARYDGDYLPGKAPMSGENSDRYLEDTKRDMPLPSNDEDLPPPEVPVE